jgi:hypothetical protein
MNDRPALAHRNAGDLTPVHIGQTITITTLGGTITGTLSDLARIADAVHLWVGGHEITAWPSTTVSIGRLDVMGGAAS